MTHKDFRKYVYWLAECIPEYMRNEAIEKLMNCDEEYVPYIISGYNTETWKYGLKIVHDMGYPKNKKAIESVLYLFKDINWTTTPLALETVKEIYRNDSDIVKKAIENTTGKAIKENDEEWLYGLNWLKEKLSI